MDLKAIVEQLEREATKRFASGQVLIGAAESLKSILSDKSVVSDEPEEAPEVVHPKKKHFSAASRRKMAEAQKARWAKYHEVRDGAPRPYGKKKRKLSPKARRAISKAQKARWAKFRKIGTQPLQIVRGKAAA